MTNNSFAYDPYIEPHLFLWDYYKGLSKIQFDRPLYDYVDDDYIQKQEGAGAWTIKENDSLLRFLILYADKNSPYHRISDFQYRRKVIIEDFLIKTLKYQSNSKLVKECENEGEIFDKFLSLYFIVVNDLDYESWFSYRMWLYNANRIIRSFKSFEDSTLSAALSNALKQIPSITKAVMELEVTLFQDPLMREKILQGKGDRVAGFAEKFASEGFASRRQQVAKIKTEDEQIKASIFSLNQNSY